MPTIIRNEKGRMYRYLKIEQAGEKIHKRLNELEKMYQSVSSKPTRYYYMLRDIENENLCDFSMFQPKKRNLERQCDQCNVVCVGILQFTSHKKSHLNYNSIYV